MMIILIILLIVLTTLTFFIPTRTKPNLDEYKGTCSTSCGIGLDNVNDPKYNIEEVIKNTLLIEQHLSERKKYCKACLVKHFLLSIGLLQESIWMAGCNCMKYPKLEESLQFYQDVFNKWRDHMDDDEVRLDSLTKLREWRREMIDLYYFS